MDKDISTCKYFGWLNLRIIVSYYVMNRQVSFLFVIILVHFSILTAQWSNDPGENLLVTDWASLPLEIAGDGDGGVFISVNRRWSQGNIPQSHPFLFCLDKYGYHKWPQPIQYGGVEDAQGQCKMFADGNKGVIIGFIDSDFLGFSEAGYILDYTIRVQKIDSLGNQLWGNGVLVSTDTLEQYDFEFASDDNGGCYISWTSEPVFGDIYDNGYRSLQHISSFGERLWGDTGMVLFDGDVSYDAFPIISDGQGGVITQYTPDEQDYFYRHLDYDGNTIWEAPLRFPRFDNKILADGNGGLITVGFIPNDPNTTTKALVIDRIMPDGNYAWDSVKTIVDTVGRQSLIRDLHYGPDSVTTVFWVNVNSNQDYNSFIQRISNNGNTQFNGMGLLPSMVYAVNRSATSMIQSNDNSFIFIFMDNRNNDIFGAYAQKINTEGEYMWDSTDVLFSTRVNAYGGGLIVSDHNGGFIAVWMESIYGIWAQQVSTNGNLGEVLLKIDETANSIPDQYQLFQNYPNPFNSHTTLSYILETNSQVSLNIYNIRGQLINTLVDQFQQKGSYEVIWDGIGVAGEPVSSGIYFYELKNSTPPKFDNSKIRKMILIK